MQIHRRSVLLQKSPPDRLGQNIRWILSTSHLCQEELTLADLLLDPELSNCQVPDLADPGSSADPDCSRNICTDLQLIGQTEISCQASEPQALSSTLDDPSKLSFARAAGYRILR